MHRTVGFPFLLFVITGFIGSSVAAQQPPQPPAKGEQPAPAKTTPASADKGAPMNLYSLKTRTLEGKDADLAQYKGKVALVVNVASECGLTPQYEGLEGLYSKLKDKGFAVLAFPSNDFGGQEPGTPAQIRTFCTEKYHVDFPMFAKVQTKAGEGQSEVYALLNKATGKLPRWNFGKYLVGKDGTVLQFFDSKVAPDDKDLLAAIDKALADKPADKPAAKPADKGGEKGK